MAFASTSLFLMAGLALGAANESSLRPPLFEGLGSHAHRVTTGSAEAQRYFDQGLALVYAFNHEEAIRAFRAAAELDPNCAMAYWGIALALGPNINAPMRKGANEMALAALEKARPLLGRVSAKERRYVEALGRRYSADPAAERKALDRAYAAAMGELSADFPSDVDAHVLHAEALMDESPWMYWMADGSPREQTPTILRELERAMEMSPNHLGANHYYIHAVESSEHPERGLASAWRLRFAAPAAGHLVHMPAHIYLRLGRYHDAVVANEEAIAADEAYIARVTAGGFYPANYYTHNIHFLCYALSMVGRRDEAIAAARKTARKLEGVDVSEMPHLVWQRSVPILATVRFGRWTEALELPEPDPSLRFEWATARFGRGLAQLRLGDAAKAEEESRRLESFASGKDSDSLEVEMFPGKSILRVASAVLRAEIAGAKRDHDQQVRLLGEAAGFESTLAYMEPPFWFIPVRQFLGAALLDRGDVAKAESIYREDLVRHPNNGWSLFGLVQCLRARGKTTEAESVERRFRDAWRRADVVLTSSRF